MQRATRNAARSAGNGRGLWTAVGIAGLAVALVLPMERPRGGYPGAAGEFLAGVVRQGNTAWGDALLRRARREPSPDVVLVAVDDHTTRAFGTAMLPRDAHARLIRNLQRAGARVIAFDFLFDRPRPGDAALAAAMRAHGRVLLAWAREESTDPNRGEAYPVLPHDALARAAFGLANVNLPNDPDGIIRRFFPSVSLPDPDDPSRLRPMPCLAVAVARASRPTPFPAHPGGESGLPVCSPLPLWGGEVGGRRPDSIPIAYRGPGGFNCRRIPYYQACWSVW